uniref:Uncharacterized protein n=1 Tax=Candidatus Kentrum sp. FM TaxID=2126340 RepID=A0A450WA62_9GAMM|nr:MAG: hypothetical protein BECKFM1743A_GA0114220_100618 [Candidatus Kentron sp. FM]VFJ48957.1 MAG: hypothetical protein BECKFM1743C_GA0114222_100658 [Candidatus Kentron sp. FM]VFK13888.1 MAG: hypothetical protein BECKFM1743B_GA0114221_102975 [Candidatus Kentron sp. FM]
MEWIVVVALAGLIVALCLVVREALLHSNVGRVRHRGRKAEVP